MHSCRGEGDCPNSKKTTTGNPSLRSDGLHMSPPSLSELLDVQPSSRFGLRPAQHVTANSGVLTHLLSVPSVARRSGAGSEVRVQASRVASTAA